MGFFVLPGARKAELQSEITAIACLSSSPHSKIGWQVPITTCDYQDCEVPS